MSHGACDGCGNAIAECDCGAVPGSPDIDWEIVTMWRVDRAAAGKRAAARIDCAADAFAALRSLLERLDPGERNAFIGEIDLALSQLAIDRLKRWHTLMRVYK